MLGSHQLRGSVACRRASIASAGLAALLGWIGPAALAQPPGANHDEAKVGPYTLPDPLIMSDGRKVNSREMWFKERRPELLRLFQAEVYGAVPEPPSPIKITFRVRSEDRTALGGTAIRREVTVAFSDRPDGPRMDLLIYLPKAASPEHRVPAFLGLNFSGNQAVHRDPGITLSRQWMRNNPQKGVTDHRAPSRRGARRRRSGRSSGSSHAATPWRQPTTATSIPTMTTGSRTESTRSSTGRARPAHPAASGAPSAPGPGA